MRTQIKIGTIAAIGITIFVGTFAFSQYLSAQVSKGVDQGYIISPEAAENYEAPPEVTSAREHINEQLEYGAQTLDSVSPNETDEYILRAVEAVRAQELRMNLPLPFEYSLPTSETDRKENVMYRDPGVTGSLNSLEERQFLNAKKFRLDNYHIALSELKRRMTTPGRNIADEAYLNEIAKDLPFYVPPIVVGNACGGSTTLGCYYGGEELEVTPLALTMNGGKDRCMILAVITHETRHYMQQKEWGLGDFYVEELEADANDFMNSITIPNC